MPAFRSPFLQVVHERGYVHQISDADALDALLEGGPQTAYIGFDCTGPSLHVGHLMGIMLLRRFQQAGHKPIVLMGGGTTKVGDPSGKDETRQLLTDAQIAANMESIKRVFARFLSFGPDAAVMVNNADWLDTLAYIPFLRDVGRHFSVNRMMSFESVKLRLEREQPLSFLEFNYMILQAYDFLELSRRFGCRLQMGGSDQWGNIVNGIDITRRIDGTEVFALTCPLITTASGAKMGKTAAGAVWLNEDMLAPYEYWQFWRNTEDADIGRFLRLFTDLPPAEIARLEQAAGAEINDAKKILATEATAMLHGRAAAEAAAETARRTFEDGATAEGLPTLEIPKARLGAGLLAANLLHEAGLATSASDARRQIKGGGVRINDTVVADEKAVVSLDQLSGGVLKLSLGKKKHVLVKAV